YCRLAKYIRLLSGLPVVQNAFDLWPQLKMLDAKVSRNPFPFKIRYCRMGGWQGKEIIGTQNVEELSGVVEAVSFRALKQQWTDLPEKLYTLRDYTLSQKQREAYSAMLRELMVVLDSGKAAVTAPLAVVQIQKLQQISSGHVYDSTGTAIDLVPPEANPKLSLLEEIGEQTPGKILVFCHFRHTLDLCRQRWP